MLNDGDSVLENILKKYNVPKIDIYEMAIDILTYLDDNKSIHTDFGYSDDENAEKLNLLDNQSNIQILRNDSVYLVCVELS